ncbi:ABC transporter permease [Paenibacillus crassostreae]|uniref:ABC transmembrane type-2 domain-containing protein n=1 Tax=Paenibacillus crassostreae TaxID=1763538 RepID=A0A167E2T1_9BACL|nr:ABC transporter permease [Paenibacillus crassostreae]AOZ93277.1 hypothetical protein LPB68_14370 [Paenibacillus crassostreae]OAB75078.1 hypothetical protein PNBC_09565 [Paenibacillus crassostreae]
MSIWTIAWYELQRMFRSKSVVINLFLLPLILIFILGAALSSFFYSDDEEFQADLVRVAMVSNKSVENGVSAKLEAYLNSENMEELIDLRQVDTREVAEKKIRAREVDYAVIVPPDFESQVMSGNIAKLELILGNKVESNLVAGMVFDTFLEEMNNGLAVASVMGNVQLEQESEPTSISVDSNSGKDAPSYVTVGNLNGSGMAYSASQYYAGAMMIMFLLYAGGTASTSLFDEKSNHTLYRLQSLPISTAQIFLGKILGNSIVAVIQATIIITVSSFLYGVEWGNQPLFLALVCLLLIIASMAIAALVTLMVKSSSSADTLMQVIIIVMTFLSGGFTPIPVDLIGVIGKLTVSYWGMESLLQMMLHSDPIDIVQSIGMLAGMCLVLVIVTTGVYRKVGYRE